MIRDLFESIIDYAHLELDPLIWEKREGKYVLRADVKDKILEYIKSYEKVDLMDILEKIHIVGSSATCQWREDSDLDVHLVPRKVVGVDLEKLREDVKMYVRMYPEYIGDHKIELYLQLDQKQDFLGDALYDFKNDEWIIEPPKIDPFFDPEKEFHDILDRLYSVMGKVDVKLGEIKRKAIDADQIRMFLKNASPEQKKWLKDKLEKKISEIEDDIEELVKEKGVWVSLRRAVYDPSVAWKDYEKSRSWGDKNVEFKFLQRYKYMDVLSALERMMNDGIVPEEIPDIKKIVGG